MNEKGVGGIKFDEVIFKIVQSYFQDRTKLFFRSYKAIFKIVQSYFLGRTKLFSRSYKAIFMIVQKYLKKVFCPERFQIPEILQTPTGV